MQRRLSWLRYKLGHGFFEVGIGEPPGSFRLARLLPSDHQSRGFDNNVLT